MSTPALPVILPPFNEATARQKVQLAEDAWNSCDPGRVARAYTEDSQWRNRDEFFVGREAIRAFLERKWQRELDYRLRKELWAFVGNRISVRFEYESRDGLVSGGAATATSTGSSRPPAHAPPRREHQRRPIELRTAHRPSELGGDAPTWFRCRRGSR